MTTLQNPHHIARCVPKKDKDDLYRFLFTEGVLCVKKDRLGEWSGELGGKKFHVRTHHIMCVMRSLLSRKLVKEQFAWRHFYWTLNDDGVAYVRKYLHLAESVIPNTQKKTKDDQQYERRAPRPDGDFRGRGRGEGRGRGRGFGRGGGDGEFRGRGRGFGRGRGGFGAERADYGAEGGAPEGETGAAPEGDSGAGFASRGRGFGFGGRGRGAAQPTSDAPADATPAPAPAAGFGLGRGRGRGAASSE